MAQSVYERLHARFEELKGQRHTTENTWQEIADNLLGRRDFNVVRTPGQQRLQKIYDDTSKVSSSLLAGAIHSLMTMARWFSLRFDEPALNEDADAMVWLDLVEKRIYAAIGAPEANFHAQLSETYIDLINFGTGAMFIEDVPGAGVQFSTRPLQELYLAENPSGRIDTIGRQFKLTARQAIELWGDEAKMAQSSADGGRYEEHHDYVHLILPNDDLVVGNIDHTGMPWASFYLSLEDKAVMERSGYPELPLMTPRWEKDPGEVYGRGPGWNALSNQKMLNEMKKVTLKAAQKAIDPPMMVGEGVLPGDLRFHPGAVIPVDTVMSMMNPPIQPIPFAGKFQIGEALIADARKAVQDSFHHQLIETIRDPRMTATQVLELAAQMQRHLAPILGRMETEFYDPALNRVFAIEWRAGRIPKPPEHVRGRQFNFNYISPIARSQQTSDARAIIDFSSFITNLSVSVPEVLDVVDFDDESRKLADALGVPPTSIRDKKAVQKRRDAAAELAAQQEAIEQAVTATDQIAKLAKAAPQQQQGAN